MKELASSTYTFAEYELDLARRLLLRAGKSVPLSAKAFDLLLVLIEHRERVLTKEELMELVWRDQFVEEANLTVQISALRKALGEKKDEHRFIVTFPGRGYRFVARVQNGNPKPDAPDIVIETHTTSHVLMEEEVETEPDPATVVNTELSQARVGGTRGSEMAACYVDSRLNQQGVIDVTFTQKFKPFKRRHVAFFAGALGVLLFGALAFWIYKSRNQNQPVTASLSPQLTMRRFTTTGGVPYRVAISPDGKSLVYWQRIGDEGKLSLWLGQIETHSSVQITQPSHTRHGHPVFAPDGGSIYFTVLDDSRPRWTLVRMPVVGGAVTELIRNVHSPVTFSPDGRQLAFVREDGKTRQTSIVIADAADGRQERTLVARQSAERFSSRGLAWSPDGQTIVVGAVKAENKREELLAVNVADGHVGRIGDRDWAHVGNLAWLPGAGGLLMVARENVTPRGNAQLWLVTYPEGAARQLTDEVNPYQLDFLSLSTDGTAALIRPHISPEIWVAPDGDVERPRRVLEGNYLRDEGRQGLAWTPEGRLLYTAFVGDSRAIWTMNSDGSNPQQLTPTQRANSVDDQMSVTADGRYVVFHSTRSGDSEIWRANLEGGDLRQLTTGGGNSQPSLSPNGQWIVYASARDGKSTLWRVSVDGGRATQISDSHLSGPEVSPDGTLIACVDPTTSPRWRLTIIPFAGGAPLKSFAVSESAYLARGLRWTPDRKAIIYLDSHQGLRRQALDEGEPQLVKGLEGFRVFQFAWSRDGKHLAYSAGKATNEIILIESFK